MPPILAFATELWHVIIAVGFGATLPVRQAMMADYFGPKFFGPPN